jgi:membrane associated rhomboid family serine protease
VAYGAHIGGFLTGVLAGGLWRLVGSKEASTLSARSPRRKG